MQQFVKTLLILSLSICPIKSISAQTLTNGSYWQINVADNFKTIKCKNYWEDNNALVYSQSIVHFDTKGQSVLSENTFSDVDSPLFINVTKYDDQGRMLVNYIFKNDTSKNNLCDSIFNYIRNDSLIYWQYGNIGSGHKIQRFYYEYDNKGNIITKPCIEWLPGYYQYDSLNRVIEINGYEYGEQFIYKNDKIFQSIENYGGRLIKTYNEKGLLIHAEEWFDDNSYTNSPNNVYEYRYIFDKRGNWTQVYLKNLHSGKEQIQSEREITYY